MTEPDATSSPEALAQALAAAFLHDDDPAAALHAVASERMRDKVGGLEGLRRAFANELYAPLVRCAGVEAAPWRLIDDTGRTVLRVRTPSGEAVAYVLAVARARHGEHAGRWRVSGLVREGVDG